METGELSVLCVAVVRARETDLSKSNEGHMVIPRLLDQSISKSIAFVRGSQLAVVEITSVLSEPTDELHICLYYKLKRHQPVKLTAVSFPTHQAVTISRHNGLVIQGKL